VKRLRDVRQISGGDVWWWISIGGSGIDIGHGYLNVWRSDGWTFVEADPELMFEFTVHGTFTGRGAERRI